MNWYVVRAISGKENKVKDDESNLLYRNSSDHQLLIAELIFSIRTSFNPSISLFKSANIVASFLTVAPYLDFWTDSALIRDTFARMFPSSIPETAGAGTSVNELLVFK